MSSLNPFNNFIHPLEPRKLLAATLDNGTLNVNGTAGNDTITVWISSPTQISVKINKSASVFNLSQVSALFIQGFAGDDTIQLPTIVAPVAIKTTIYGDAGNDLIQAAPNAANRIFGDDGNDTITSFNGKDTIYGEGGDDFISSGNGNDLLDGGDGGDDTVSGGDGNDQIRGLDGNDLLMGDAGNDIITGGTGDDTIYGGDDNDVLVGDTGNDYLSGDAGADDLDGGQDTDTMIGGPGNDDTFGFDDTQALKDNKKEDSGLNANPDGEAYYT